MATSNLSQQLFSGIHGEDLEEWLRNFEQNAILSKLSPGKKLRMLKNCLKGEAELEFKKLSQEAKSNYDTIVERLRDIKVRTCINTNMKLFSQVLSQINSGNKILIKIQQDVDKIANVEYPKGINDQWKIKNYKPSKDDINYLNNYARVFIRGGYLYYKYGHAIKKLGESLNEYYGEGRKTWFMCLAYFQSYEAFRSLNKNCQRIEDATNMLYSFQKLCSSLNDKTILLDSVYGTVIAVVKQKAVDKLTKDSAWIDRATVLFAKNLIASDLLIRNSYSEAASLYRSILNIPPSGYSNADCIIKMAKYNLAILTRKIKKQHTIELCQEMELKIKATQFKTIKTEWYTISKDMNSLDLRQCANCNIEKVKMQSCKRCRDVGLSTYYCSKECQIDHWSFHVQFCAKV